MQVGFVALALLKTVGRDLNQKRENSEPLFSLWEVELTDMKIGRNESSD